MSAWNAKGGGRGTVIISDVLGHEGPLGDVDIENLRPEDVEGLAWGWSGFGQNKHIPGANITTAYRNSMRGRALSRERRLTPEDRFKIGPHLGELVTATAVLWGARPDELSLEAWESNDANGLYDAMGYGEPVVVEPAVRPTLKPVGTVIGGNVVYLGDDGQHMVEDNRLHRRLENHPLLAQAA